jgi:hypothetical protein
MSTGAIVGIIIAVVVVAALIIGVPPLLRQRRMRRQFGPEYDRLARDVGARKAAAELTDRQRRVDARGIHPLSAVQPTRYRGEWAMVQQRFVEAPAAAVSEADTLIWAVMRDRGYPADNRDASVEALSVYHARPLDGYRQSQSVRTEGASTEALRTAMINYRALFQDLVGAQGSQAALDGRTATPPRPVADADADADAQEIATVPSDTADTPR